jgi:hypothetical protein
MLYQNGRLLTYPLSSGSANTLTVAQSLNAGKSAATRLMAGIPQAYTSTNLPNGRNVFASYAGATYQIAGGISSVNPGIWRSTDDFATVPTSVYASGNSSAVFYAIASRDS